MKKIRIFIALLIVVSIMTTSAITFAEALGDVEPGGDKGCSHTYEIVSSEEYLGDENGKCKVRVTELQVCTKCQYEIVISEVTFSRDHVSYIFKSVCDRATHIYYCKCKCGKGMPTIRDVCPRPGIGCPDMLS